MPPRDFQTRLSRRGVRAGLQLTEELVAQLDVFYALLTRWNQKINLTSLSNLDEAVDRLFLEPLLAARYVPPGTLSLLDIGSGGGSPAIPLALATGLPLTMVEAKARKSAFLREAVRHLGIEARVENARIEDLLARPDLHEAFDLVSLRAVRVEARTLLTFQAFLRPAGQMMLFRGPTGPESPSVVPPLEVVATHQLVDSLQSRVTMLLKRPIGPEKADVPRGTYPTSH